MCHGVPRAALLTIGQAGIVGVLMEGDSSEAESVTLTQAPTEHTCGDEVGRPSTGEQEKLACSAGG